MMQPEQPSLSGSKRTASESGHRAPVANKTRKVEKRGETYLVKGSWAPEEDALLVKATKELGISDWRLVSAQVPGRTPKQCRDRYRLKLDPNINHSPFTPEEDKALLKYQKELGNQWTKIAKKMKGRTENSVKSRFASLDRAKNREWTDDEDMILRSCKARNLSFTDISDRFLTKRSEHAVKKRWEKLFMRDLAKKIRDEIPNQQQQQQQQQQQEQHHHQQEQQELPHQLQQPYGNEVKYSTNGTTITSMPPPTTDYQAPQTSVQSPTMIPLPPNVAGGAESAPSPPGQLKLPLKLEAPSVLPAPQLQLPGEGRADHPYGFLAENTPAGVLESNRVGNLKRQTTSVTVLQKIIGEPLQPHLGGS